MQPEADLNRIRHMADAAREAIGFAAGHSRADLDTNRMLARAIVKSIEIVGEAATKISESARSVLPPLPWPDLIAMRHRLIHAYFDVNLDIVWGTVEMDLPPLVAALDDWLVRHVIVVLNDNGGLNSSANAWLKNAPLPCQVTGPRALVLTVESTFRDRDDMFRVSPSTLTLARRVGFDGEDLSKHAAVSFLAVLA